MFLSMLKTTFPTHIPWAWGQSAATSGVDMCLPVAAVYMHVHVVGPPAPSEWGDILGHDSVSHTLCVVGNGLLYPGLTLGSY